MKKKTIKRIAVLSLILALVGIGLGAFILSTQPEDQALNVDALYRENEELRLQIDELREQLAQFMTVSSLKEWNLTATPWTDSTGADVTFTAVPSEYQAGMGATLVVMLGERQTAAVPCVWDGNRFAATVNLNAADGYSYFCMLSGPNGMQQLSLMGPDSEKPGIPVFLQSALSSYCNLVVNDWISENNSLILKGAYAQVQLPQIQVRDLQISSQTLVLRLNGQVSSKVPVALIPSEVAGSYEVVITDLQIPMPELKADDVLELHLEVSLSDGRHLQAFGISWYLEDGELASFVG